MTQLDNSLLDMRVFLYENICIHYVRPYIIVRGVLQPDADIDIRPKNAVLISLKLHII